MDKKQTTNKIKLLKIYKHQLSYSIKELQKKAASKKETALTHFNISNNSIIVNHRRTIHFLNKHIVNPQTTLPH